MQASSFWLMCLSSFSFLAVFVSPKKFIAHEVCARLDQQEW